MTGSSSEYPRPNSPPTPTPIPPDLSKVAEEYFGLLEDPYEQPRYNVLSVSSRPSATFCFPEAHSPDIQDFNMGDPHTPIRRLSNLDFIPTNEGSLLGSSNTRIAALRTSSTDVQNRYSQAVNASIPANPGRDRSLRMCITNALWNSTAFFAEGETVSQLLRYREMFAFLSQRHAEALASNSLDMAQSLIRRGQISVAAIRITGRQAQSLYNNGVAHGCVARNSSEVSVWGWKPWKEMAMAEKISERRRKKAAMEREKIRERSVRKTYRLYTDIDDEISSSVVTDIHDQHKPDGDEPWAGTRLNVPYAESEDYFDNRNTYISHSTICRENSNSTSSSSSSSEISTGVSSPGLSDFLAGDGGPLTDGTREHEFDSDISEDKDAPAGWKWPPQTEPETQWHIPVYDEVKPNNSALAQNDGGVGSVSLTGPGGANWSIPTTVAVAYAGDSFIRAQTSNMPSDIGYLQSPFPGLRLTPQVSPKSVPPYVPSSSGNETYDSSVPTASDISTSTSLESPISFDRMLFERRRPQITDSNSDSTVGASRARNHLRKMKTAFKSIPLTRIHFPWSSSDEEGVADLGGVQTNSTDSSFATGSEQSWPPTSIPPEYGLVPPPPPLRVFMPYVEPATPETRIHSPHPKMAATSHSPSPHPGIRVDSFDTSVSGFSTWKGMSITKHRESDPLTRTEKEYQELLTMLNELKRELRMRRKRRGKKSRGEKQGAGRS